MLKAYRVSRKERTVGLTFPNPFRALRIGSLLAAIDSYALRWANRNGWTETIVELSFECYEDAMIDLLPVSRKEAKRGVCNVFKLARAGTNDVAFLYIFHNETWSSKTFALVELTEEQFEQFYVHQAASSQ